MTKYQPLAEYLTKIKASKFEIPFNALEKILGFSLPPSAYEHSAWWGNSKTNDTHTWAHLWVKLGWEVKVNLPEKIVNFNRVNAGFDHFGATDKSVYEREKVERNYLTAKRNQKIVQQRKKMDNYTCQACGFKLSILKKFVIEAHHLNPLGDSDDDTITSIDDLISLCPTCHRIAHMRDPLYPVAEIKEMLSEKS